MLPTEFASATSCIETAQSERAASHQWLETKIASERHHSVIGLLRLLDLEAIGPDISKRLQRPALGRALAILSRASDSSLRKRQGLFEATAMPIGVGQTAVDVGQRRFQLLAGRVL